MFCGRVLDDMWPGRASAIGDRYPDDGLVPGDLYGEQAAATARGMPECVAA
jgi:hypothetical protein